MRKLLLLTAVAAAAAAAAAGARATGPGHKGSATRSVVISTRRLPQLGTVLVDGNGRTLYMLVPDRRRLVTCTATCALVWPPLRLAKGLSALARGEAKSHLLASARDPAGGAVVTYDGWPLYTYVGDTAPGQARGQALDLNGGLWYVLAPSGKMIRRRG